MAVSTALLALVLDAAAVPVSRGRTLVSVVDFSDVALDFESVVAVVVDDVFLVFGRARSNCGHPLVESRLGVEPRLEAVHLGTT